MSSVYSSVSNIYFSNIRSTLLFQYFVMQTRNNNLSASGQTLRYIRYLITYIPCLKKQPLQIIVYSFVVECNVFVLRDMLIFNRHSEIFVRHFISYMRTRHILLENRNRASNEFHIVNTSYKGKFFK